MHKHLFGFTHFIRSQGVVGLAVGIILGGSVKELVTALINDIINPILGFVLGAGGNLKLATLQIGPVILLWGHFLGVLIDFAVIAAVVYFFVKGFGFDKLDKKE
ncbi:MscL family protein [Patescibacteria group bacterium]|nr:MscL family protein [Patescibacteria group bacterium]